ncbi:DUF5134 domain-containing protein [Kitasatospora sp. RB6PN24]|uniref:DUF5134 domain-containing protein n=1 Tax=Kitasatospora humi TaxID=2893891 RepID=UPI001E4EA165|nr:DUF5134 domain-containing protein [Kitasatospora humi]MCC9310978.1 DUF5134 domain-containing protein [Kitasatospora humi]
MTFLTAATGLYCALRCHLAPGTTREERHLDASTALKGLSMAAMALPFGAGRAVPELLWPVVLVPAALWSASGVLRSSVHRRHRIEHTVGHLAMLYMAVAMYSRVSSSAEMAGMPDMAAVQGPAWLTAVLMLFFATASAVSCTRLFIPAAARTGSGDLLWAPQVKEACHLVLGISMFTMLLTL